MSVSLLRLSVTSTSATACYDSEDGHPCNNGLMGDSTPWHKNDHHGSEEREHELLSVHSMATKGIAEEAKELLVVHVSRYVSSHGAR